MTLAVALAAIGLAAAALAAVVYFASRALTLSGDNGDAREARAKADGRANAADKETTRANDATAVALDAQRRQQNRADALEEELTDVESNPVALVGDPAVRAGRARLRASLRLAAALDPRAGDDGAGGEGQVSSEGPATTPR